jgi:cytochrome c1
VAYGRYYAVCHGAQGSDWQNVDLKAVKRKMNAEQLVAFMCNPRAPMPKPFAEPWSSADEQRARDIAAFLMQWQ